MPVCVCVTTGSTQPTATSQEQPPVPAVSTAPSQEQSTPVPVVSTPTATSHQQRTEHTPGRDEYRFLQLRSCEALGLQIPLTCVCVLTICFTTGSPQPTASLVFKLNMITLRRLSTHNGVINIMQQTAARYRDIGILLLNDGNGAIVRGIEVSTRGDPVAAVDMIYTRWMEEDVSYSWKKLTQCFRDCGLNTLASDIEQHFGLPSPQQSMS